MLFLKPSALIEMEYQMKRQKGDLNNMDITSYKKRIKLPLFRYCLINLRVYSS